MEQADVVAAIEAMTGASTGMADGNYFFFYDPTGDDPKDRYFPFATLMTNDVNDEASNLSRPGAFRLNVGVGPDTYRALVPDGSQMPSDFSVADRLMPHPVYAAQRWLCVVNPSAATFERLRPLLDEAHGIAKRRYERRRAAGGGGAADDTTDEQW